MAKEKDRSPTNPGHYEGPPKQRVGRIVRAVLIFGIIAQGLFFISNFNTKYLTVTKAVYEDVVKLRGVDPAAVFNDDIWPIREPTPWDISTDFPYPRLLEYDVDEGTWMRLDVHPVSGEIVFDLLGDIYCLPSSSYSQNNGVTQALPVLMGIPHDSEPRFSPEGSLLAFRSDAELGVENIWVTEWKGCDAMDVRPTGGQRASSDHLVVQALDSQSTDEEELAAGIKEDADKRRRRLLREGRMSARRVTNETYRWVSDARFHPSGNKIIATKRYFSTRSLGAGEGWEYQLPVPSESSADKNINVGSGKRVVGRTLPVGWSPARYNSQQVGPEQFIWYGDDVIIYSKNTLDVNGVFQYSKDIHSGIYSIFKQNLTTGRTEILVDAYPGGASRPELSHDGKTLAFVRRVRDKEALVFKDMHSGTIRHIWYGLTYDAQAIYAPMGTYPSFAFTPSDDAVIIWASGKLWKVPVAFNGVGERVLSGDPVIIHFRAHIEHRLAETRKENIDLSFETADEQRLHAFKNLEVSGDGTRVVFEGSGRNYFVDVLKSSSDTIEKTSATLIPKLHPDSAYYSPSFVPGTNNLVIQTRWSDRNFSSFELADLSRNVTYEITGVEMGRYSHPVVCSCPGSTRQIAFVKTGGDLLTGDVVATANLGLYLGQITLPDTQSLQSLSKDIPVSNVRRVPTPINLGFGISSMRFVEENQKLLIQYYGSSFLVDLVFSSVNPDRAGDYNTTFLAYGFTAHELAPSSEMPEYIAFVDFMNVFVVKWTNAKGQRLWSKPGNATNGLARVSLDGGHDIRWDSSGERLFWLLGPYLHSLEASKLSQCKNEIKSDQIRFGVDCIKNLLDIQEIDVTFTSELGRLKQDARVRYSEASNVAESDVDVLVIMNATILTMESGNGEGIDLVKEGSLVIRGGIIENVGDMKNVAIPQGSITVDAHGGYIVPGFIDNHAHWGGFGDIYPARSWELETFLAYGVTTLHNPSSDNVLGFVERGRVENGGMVGPRIYHTGNVIYGAEAPHYHTDVADMDDARSSLLRIKVEGGPASFSYKNYNQYSRNGFPAKTIAGLPGVINVGMNQDWDITYIIDGMTTVEHNLPIPELYDDVITLFALSGTGSTPTHIVNYGGVHGEQLVWHHYDIPNDPKLRQFTDHATLEALSETTSRPRNSFALFNTSTSIAKMVKKGLRTHIGAHGEPPLGLNYHAEMYFASQGGLTNYEVIRAATLDAAITLGVQSSLGSLSPGKFADFVVYPPNFDVLNDNITGSKDIRFVARGGRLWDAKTMVEVWPRMGFKSPMPPINAD